MLFYHIILEPLSVLNQIKSTLFENINIIKLCTGLESEKNSFELTVSCLSTDKKQLLTSKK